MKTALLIVLIALSAFGQSQSDSLPRRGFFGVGLDKAEGGARVTSVFPGSTAADAGIAAGDVIVRIDTRITDSPDAVIAAMGQHKSGEVAKIELLRNGERRAIDTLLKAYPAEQMANATVTYGSVVASPGVRLRTILSIPTAPQKQFPAILLIQGGGCGSIDSPFSVDTAQPGLIHHMGSNGFVTMRVEKSGVGDSQGPPCSSIGYNEELSGYRAALKVLQLHPSVDPQRIYLLGISLGGVFAPILAAEMKVAGISVYGTLSNSPPPYPGRSDRFFEEFAAVDVPAAWAKAQTRVQVLHGEYDVDPQTDKRANERIAEIVNRSSNASAQFRELPQLDHCWSRHASLEASKDKCGQGESTNALADAILDFLRATDSR